MTYHRSREQVASVEVSGNPRLYRNSDRDHSTAVRAKSMIRQRLPSQDSLWKSD